MSQNFSTISALVCGLLIVVAIFASRRRRLQYPPGPPRLPLVGNLFQLTPDKIWLSFTKWRDEYGSLVFLNVLGQPVIILNSHKAAADLLDRRASIYSDRPRNIVASDMLTGGLLVVFTQFGDRWRKMRRAAHEQLHNDAIRAFVPHMALEAILLTEGLLANTGDWDAQFRRSSASLIASATYALPPLKSATDPSIARINNFVARLTSAAQPGANYVEFLPWMRFLPEFIAPWKRNALKWHRIDGKMFESLYGDVQSRVGAGEAITSFSSALEESRVRHALSTTESAWLSATLYAAGAETTSATLSWALLGILSSPDAQECAHAELDAVVGRSRMPTMADYDSLPYVRALVKEALRWSPVDPMGLPHRLTEDDVYEGYFIPKSTICIANVWALNRDTSVYGEDAHLFRPSRFLDDHGQLRSSPKDTKDEGHVTFGFGRRICVGRHFANKSMFLELASILWAMTIKAGDSPLDCEGCIDTGLVVRPLPFECTFLPRFHHAVDVVSKSKGELLV